MLIIFTENFPKTSLRGASARFRTSYRRSRIRPNPEQAYFEEFDSKIQNRIKQYRFQGDDKDKQST